MEYQNSIQQNAGPRTPVSSTLAASSEPISSYDSLDCRLLAGMVILDVEVSKEYDAGVGGQKDEDVPEAVQVLEAQAGPEAAEQAVAHPA